MELSVAMKRIPFIIILLLLVPYLVAAQDQIRERRSADRESSPSGDSTSIRNRTVSAPRSNHVESDRAESEAKPAPVSDSTLQSTKQERSRWGNASVEIRPSVIERPSASQNSTDRTPTNNAPDNTVAKKLVQKTAMVTESQPNLQPPRSNVHTRPAPLSRALPRRDRRRARHPTLESTNS